MNILLGALLTLWTVSGWFYVTSQKGATQLVAGGNIFNETGSRTSRGGRVSWLCAQFFRQRRCKVRIGVRDGDVAHCKGRHNHPPTYDQLKHGGTARCPDLEGKYRLTGRWMPPGTVKAKVTHRPKITPMLPMAPDCAPGRSFDKPLWRSTTVFSIAVHWYRKHCILIYCT